MSSNMNEGEPTVKTLISSTNFIAINDESTFLNNFNLTLNESETQNTTEVNIYTYYTSLQFMVMTILFFAIVFGNISVIVAMLFTKTRKSRMNYFILQLAIADLFVGLFYIPIDIVQKVIIAWTYGEFACKMIKFSQALSMYASTYVLVALSIDRCDAITNPMNFTGSRMRARILIVCSWVLSVFFSIPLFLFFEVKEIQGALQCWIDFETPKQWQIYMTSVSLSILVMPALIITLCYTVIIITIWHKSKLVNVGARPKGKAFKGPDSDMESRRASSRGLIPRAKIKSVKMTFVIVFVFIICWSPYIGFDLLQVYGYIPNSQTAIAVATLIQSLAPLNSAANPIICCLFSPHICSGLSKVPPYSWILNRIGNRLRKSSRSRSDSTANSELISNHSTHKRLKLNHSTAAILNMSTRGSYSFSSDNGCGRTPTHTVLLTSSIRD